MNVDWGRVWELVWPVVRQGLIALLVALLSLLGYDRYVPSRMGRTEASRQARRGDDGGQG